ncbi:MAG: ATP synthase F1 subunit epsilon [Paludibacteraceae bacterium]|jgi:F-type H+-transporting ATPase subunit epsilon|nr:ATP synthase F1 subunit epsilon [Bacteroidales bacterium]MBO5133034.1 ATP synthase F1 subunit epsilon [Paludibacteraceae bacterium]MBO5829092.1 ATP synthase F1 subunit epsilon [Paludibacteraceae bacterium]MBQ9101044.1 ATP synthase F1 subunit epsilon [Paludibacteraceae bacterium]MBR6659951.1 ATP synthase F1 subunit epsilon [Paludibacteraceae bacterium]
MKLEIISPDKLVFSGEVDSVNLPGGGGRFTVLPRHAALISSLLNGELSYTMEGATTTIKIDGGFAEVKEDTIYVCVENIIEE